LYTPISISGIASVSALGTSPQEVWQRYTSGIPAFTKKNDVWQAPIHPNHQTEIKELRKENKSYKELDRSVILAMLAAKRAMPESFETYKNVGVNIGSSRGATSLFEKYYDEFTEKESVTPLTSPTTTLGNISSWVGQQLGAQGPVISHSVTCSTSLHAMLNGIAWLQAGMADGFVVGGGEAPLTPFTIGQMQALKLYSKSTNEWACESLKLSKKSNSMVLGEAGAIAFLEKGISNRTRALVSGYGYASEKLDHNISISESAHCFQESMRMAMAHAQLDSVDAIIMHAPGTVKGDQAEYNAVSEVFGNKLPQLTTNKWILGHTLGASGMMSVEMAVLMLEHNQFIKTPFYNNTSDVPTTLKNILINAVGFGGNAVSIIVTKL